MGHTERNGQGDCRETLSVVDMEPGSVIEEHSHPHEQVGHVISGEIEITIGGELRLLRVTQIESERVCLHYRLLHFTGSKA